MKHLNKLLEDLELDSKVIFLNEGSTRLHVQNLTKETQKRLKILSPDAVYIFNSQPLILFYDLNKNPKNKTELHKKIWSFDEAPIVFIIDKDDIQVFNALNYVKENEEQGLEQLNISIDQIKKHFNLWELESGHTWLWFQESYLEKKKKNRVNKRLFDNIKTVRNHLVDEEKLTDNQANSLILRLIFIRYLIDRRVKIDENLLPGLPEDVNQRRKNLISLIKQPNQLNQLFEKLNDKFNGVLFKESNTITKEQADYLSGVFAGELEGKDSLFEGFFFEIFDFSVIPVELISGIYESLIDEEQRNEDSAVYTPSFLVDYTLKDTVDEFLKTNKPEECTVFEVAVGSGIFLVQSLRRMIEKEIELNGKRNKEEFGEKIKSFAENNLYGIDINSEALKVTCFSIYIALLDYLNPADINNYKFPKLIGNSLFEANFFDENHLFNSVINSVKPKFFLGNPPWKNGKTDKKHLEYIKGKKFLKVVSNYQISQSFILRTEDFKKFSPVCSLIITSKAIHNNNSNTFKNHFLKHNLLLRCLDLSPVRRFIFNDKINPAMILSFITSDQKEHEDNRDNIVLHSSIKINTFLKNFKILALEKFDQKRIFQKHFIENDWMFKVALYGNSLDFNLIRKIGKFDTLNVFLNRNNIINGNGIKRGTPKRFFNELIGLPIIESNKIKQFWTKPENDPPKLKKEDVFLESGRSIDLFRGNKILFKKRTVKETEIAVSYIEEDIVFRDSINAITFNESNKQYLSDIFNTLISDLFTYYQYMTSSSWGVYYPEIHKVEYLSFPFIEPKEEIKEKFNTLFSELINSLKANYTASDDTSSSKRILEEINNIIYDLYEINEYQRDLIDYVLKVSRYQFQESKQNKFFRKVDKDKNFLLKYANVFLIEIEDIYPAEFIQIEVYSLKYFIAMNFVFKEKDPEQKIVFPESPNVQTVLQALADNFSVSKLINTDDPEKNLFIQKDIKGFEKDSFYIIKPNEFKSWHRARAWYDVAEIKEALQNAELDTLNNSAEWV